MSRILGWFSRAAVSARNWVRNHRTVGLVTLGVSVFLVIASGVGATLAVTGVLSPAGTTATPAPSPSITASPNVGTGSTPADDPMDSFGGGWSSLQAPGGLGFRWQGRSLEVIWTGACTSGPIEVTVGPQDWGQLAHPIGGIGGVGGTASTVLCNGGTTMMGTGDEGLGGPGYWKCFGFSEVWIRVSGNTPDAGLHKMAIPSSIPRRACPVVDPPPAPTPVPVASATPTPRAPEPGPTPGATAG